MNTREQSEGSASHAAVILPVPNDTLPFSRYAWAVFLSYLLWLIGSGGFIFSFFAAPLSFLKYAPIGFGLWIGFRRNGRPLGIYAASGAAVGALAMVTIYVMWRIADPQDSDLRTLTGLLYIFFAYFFGPALLFWSGTLLGDFAKRRALGPGVIRPEAASPASGATTSQNDMKIAYISLVGSIITGILGICGSVAAALVLASN